MIIIKNIPLARDSCAKAKLKNKTIGLVPTMGALHEGHLGLIRKARKVNDLVVVSIFVNPIQFGPKEDLKKYPRDLAKDAALCKNEGVDIIFYPQVKEMYPATFRTHITVEDFSLRLCGKFRPGHFKGVATVVAKLFNIVQPDNAYFGQKDAQQAVIIKKMADDLNMPVRIKVLPIVREKDGLAMSSRNVYLNRQQRQDAAVLFQSLNMARRQIKRGTKDCSKIIAAMKKMIETKKTTSIEYISIVNAKDLRPIVKIKGRCLIALAVWVGRTRLIDNIIVNG